VVDDEAQGLDAGAGVRTVAEGLILRAPAAAIEVRLSLGELDLVGARLSDDRLFCHAHFSHRYPAALRGAALRTICRWLTASVQRDKSCTLTWIACLRGESRR
jgi:hypothetical protein